VYQEMKIYENQYESIAFVCRGAAINFANQFECHLPRIPIEGKLLYTKRQLAELNQLRETKSQIEIYRYVVSKDGQRRTSSWFLTEMDARNTPLAKEYSQANFCEEDGCFIDTWVESWWLVLTEVKPIQLPIIVDIEPSGDGRFCARINIHPEYEGTAARGIICFPDRSMKNVCEGKAVITDILDKGSYAFLTGHMLRYGMPDRKKFLDYAWKNLHADMATKLFVVNHPSFGKILCSEKYIWVETAACKGIADYGNEPFLKIDWNMPDDIQSYMERETSLSQMILEDAFGEERVSELLAGFVSCNGLKHRYNEHWTYDDKFISPLVDQAIVEGIISAFRLLNADIHALELRPDNLYRLAGFSDKEVQELIADYSCVNREADERITGKLKKGILRPAQLS